MWIETSTGAFRGQIITAFIPGDYLWSTGVVCAQDITAFLTAFVPHDAKLSEERTNAAKERDNSQHRQMAPETAPAEDQADDADSNALLTLAAMCEQLAKAKAARTKEKSKRESTRRKKGTMPNTSKQLLKQPLPKIRLTPLTATRHSLAPLMLMTQTVLPHSSSKY